MGNKEIIDYIGRRYSFFKKLSLKLTRDEDKANDLLSSVIIQYSNREDIETRNINGFVFMSLRNNYYSVTSPYYTLFNNNVKYDYDYEQYIIDLENEEVGKHIELLEDKQKKSNNILYTYDLEYVDNMNFNDDENEDITLYNEIVKRVLECPELTWYEKKIWKMYYNADDVYNIDKMELKDVQKIRKNSYRNIQKKTRINYQTICNVVNEVNRKVEFIFDEYRKNK